MSTSAAFDFVSEQMERLTPLNRIEARGTIRIALKEAGLDSATVSPPQMSVVVTRVIPGQLAMRGVSDAETLCQTIDQGLSLVDSAVTGPSTDDVFRRLGG